MNFKDMAQANDRNPRGVFGENIYFDNTKEDWARMEGYSEPKRTIEEVKKEAYTFTDSETIKKRNAERRRRDPVNKGKTKEHNYNTFHLASFFAYSHFIIFVDPSRI